MKNIFYFKFSSLAVITEAYCSKNIHTVVSKTHRVYHVGSLISIKAHFGWKSYFYKKSTCFVVSVVDRVLAVRHSIIQ